MNRTTLSTLVALSAIGLTQSTLATELKAPTVYGKVNVSLNSNSFESIVAGSAKSTTDNWTLNSNSSRIGFKGDIPIEGNLVGVYGLEYEVIPDADKQGDGSSPFKQRNTFAGLQHKDFGTLVFGRHDTPLKLSQDKVDQFNDLSVGDLANVMVGDNRLNNGIVYTSPTLAGFNLAVGFAAGEGSGENTGTSANDKHDNDDNGPADHSSVALSYRLDTLYLALAHDTNVERSDVTRFTASYELKPVKLGAIYQTAERTEDYDVVGKYRTGFDFVPTGSFKEQDAWLISTAVAIDSLWTAKLQLAQSKSTPSAAGLSDTKAFQRAIGIDRKLGSNSSVFAYYAAIETEGDRSISTDEATDSTVGIGYELKF